MRELGIKGVTRRRSKKGTTKRDADAKPAPDLVNRDFSAGGPDRLWVADITQVPTEAGWLYLAVVLDAWSRRIVGWAMTTHMRVELVNGALDMVPGHVSPSVAENEAVPGYSPGEGGVGGRRVTATR